MINIILADDEALFRKGMILLMSDYEEIHIYDEACDGQDLLEKLEAGETVPDVLLLDLNMPRLSGIEASKIIKEKYPDLKIIIISTYFSDAFVMNMIELGAAAYLPKNTEPSIVAATIKEVHEKGFSYSKEVMEVIHKNLQQKNKIKGKKDFKVDLTKREKEILQLICQEYTTGEIAEKLFISPRTVEGHRNNLLLKLDCRNTAGLVVCAIQKKLVQVKPERYLFGGRE